MTAENEYLVLFTFKWGLVNHEQAHNKPPPCQGFFGDSDLDKIHRQVERSNRKDQKSIVEIPNLPCSFLLSPTFWELKMKERNFKMNDYLFWKIN